MTRLVSNRLNRLGQSIIRLTPGLALAGLVAMSAQFVAEHSQAPAMMMALLFGLVINFVHDADPKVGPGIEFGAKSVLKLGIILLGTRISVDAILLVGWQTFALVASGVFATMIFGLLVGRLFGIERPFAILTAGAVAICGASAALAISTVLPKTKDSEQQLFVTIIGVTTLSTVAMILYPALLSSIGVSDSISGRIIGAAIHDVAQVVGAGFSVSEQAGDTATLVKLLRVSLLAPTVIILSLTMRRRPRAEKNCESKTPIIPLFVVGFFCLAFLNSLGLIPDPLQAPLSTASKAALLTAIAAVGVKTNLKQVATIGYAPIALMVLETVFIAFIATVGFLIIT